MRETKSRAENCGFESHLSIVESLHKPLRCFIVCVCVLIRLTVLYAVLTGCIETQQSGSLFCFLFFFFIVVVFIPTVAEVDCTCASGNSLICSHCSLFAVCFLALQHHYLVSVQPSISVVLIKLKRFVSALELILRHDSGTWLCPVFSLNFDMCLIQNAQSLKSIYPKIQMQRMKKNGNCFSPAIKHLELAAQQCLF